MKMWHKYKFKQKIHKNPQKYKQKYKESTIANANTHTTCDFHGVHGQVQTQKKNNTNITHR